MANSSYASETDSWPPQPKLWVNRIMTCISQLSEGMPEASAKKVERNHRVQFELRVEWCDKLMKELMVETFTYEPDSKAVLSQ